MPQFGGGKKCLRCGKSVYANEEIIAAGGSFHKRGCFTCKDCNKSLDSNTVAERKGEEVNEIYCKSCYGKNFGPTGYGYGGGAGALTNTGATYHYVTAYRTAIHQSLQVRNFPIQLAAMPQFGGGKKCVRCCKSVYSNEEIIAAGGSFHKRGCFTCKECNKSLDSNTVAERKGDEVNEIYCKGCYGRNFGPKGYGYGGGAGALTNTGQ
ncbi:cysteine and glycine-rich protein 1-like [Tubulanus polymorphus]|uniref:cysteine and glycine-rich protein 1-like n=1 Tax=Tubulanus polymorphus TaxID=672921 RepID=UPI003DA53C09